MEVESLRMRKEVHTRARNTVILLAVCLTAVLLPVTVLFSREGEAASQAAIHSDAIPSELALSIAPSPVVVTTTAPGWTGDAAQSASMVLVGTLLIGLGSLVRRSV
jgi:uncharacterized membrane protein